MLVNIAVNEDNIRVVYESSNIISSIYDKKTLDLIVNFKNNTSYSYSGVKETDYYRFYTAESQGKVLNQIIKKYPTKKIIDNGYLDVKSDQLILENYKKNKTEHE
jgi:hypothetical protein